MSRFHHGRQDADPRSPDRSAHAETDAPAAMIERLLSHVFRIFYAGQNGKRWLQDQRPLMQVLTWPAVWLNERAIGLPAADYEAKMLEILRTIEAHGKTREIKLVPAYLGDCVRKHFVHHGDELYEARKHLRNAIDLSALKHAPRREPDAVPVLLQVRAVLGTAKKRGKGRPEDGLQGSLF